MCFNHTSWIYMLRRIYMLCIHIDISFLTYNKFAQDSDYMFVSVEKCCSSPLFIDLCLPSKWKRKNVLSLFFLFHSTIFLVVHFYLVRFIKKQKRFSSTHADKIGIDIGLSRKYLSINQIFKIDDKFYFIFNPIINTLI